jgi:anti-sigma-K factor RskA
MSMHDELKASAAGYVLGSLDAQERREFEAHLAGCAECAEDVASLRPVVSALATAVPQVTPRAELRDRVIGDANSVGAGPGAGAGV